MTSLSKLNLYIFAIFFLSLFLQVITNVIIFFYGEGVAFITKDKTIVKSKRNLNTYLYFKNGYFSAWPYENIWKKVNFDKPS